MLYGKKEKSDFINTHYILLEIEWNGKNWLLDNKKLIGTPSALVWTINNMSGLSG